MGQVPITARQEPRLVRHEGRPTNGGRVGPATDDGLATRGTYAKDRPSDTGARHQGVKAATSAHDARADSSQAF